MPVKHQGTDFGQAFVGEITPSHVFGLRTVVVCTHSTQLALQALTQHFLAPTSVVGGAGGCWMRLLVVLFYFESD